MSLPLVLLHGWGLAPAVWDELIPALGRPCLAPALPAHGAPPVAGGIDAWADALAAQLPERAALCGWSLGGLLALALAARAPERVERLVLLGATPCFVQREDWPCAQPAETVAGFRREFDIDPQTVRKRFVALQALGDAERRTVSSALAAALAPITPALADGLRILAEADLRAALPAIACPVRVLHGRHDALMPVEAAVRMADALPEARLTVFDDCGHAPFLGRSDHCATLIRAFLDE